MEPARFGSNRSGISASHRTRASISSLSNLLQRLLTAQGMTFHLEAKVGAIKVDNGRATVTATKDGQELKFDADKVLVSVGRRPFSDGGAEKVGVEFDEKRRIKVDKNYRTNVEGIYAIGDVIAGPMLAHKAEHDGTPGVHRNHRGQSWSRELPGHCWHHLY